MLQRLVLPGALISACFLHTACSYEDKAAKILQATLTYQTWNLDSSGKRDSLPSEMTCGSGTVKVDGGTISFTATQPAGGKSQIKVEMEAGIPAETDSSGSTSGGGTFECNVTLEYDATLEGNELTLSGQPEIPSCSGFDCTYRKHELDCEKLKESLKTACKKD